MKSRVAVFGKNMKNRVAVFGKKYLSVEIGICSWNLPQASPKLSLQDAEA